MLSQGGFGGEVGRLFEPIPNTELMTMPDTIQIMCPNLTCKKLLAVPQSARGKTVRCKTCQTAIRVPGTPPATSGKKKSA